MHFDFKISHFFIKAKLEDQEIDPDDLIKEKIEQMGDRGEKCFVYAKPYAHQALDSAMEVLDEIYFNRWQSFIREDLANVDIKYKKEVGTIYSYISKIKKCRDNLEDCTSLTIKATTNRLESYTKDEFKKSNNTETATLHTIEAVRSNITEVRDYLLYAKKEIEQDDEFEVDTIKSQNKLEGVFKAFKEQIEKKYKEIGRELVEQKQESLFESLKKTLMDKIEAPIKENCEQIDAPFKETNVDSQIIAEENRILQDTLFEEYMHEGL